MSPSPVVVALLGLVAAIAWAAPPPIDAVSYANDAAAQAAWQPMKGTTPVSLTKVDGAPALRLPCRFAGNAVERASWDLAVNLDLSTARGVQFELRCQDASPVAYFSLYFQSGDGWYHTNFFPETAGQWETLVVDKASAGTEGKPAGWSRITTIRLSAWRGDARDTELLLRNFRVRGGAADDASVVVIRGDSAADQSADEAKSAAQFAEVMAERLASAGIEAVTVSDKDVTPALLKPFAVAVLPHNPVAPAAMVDALAGFLGAGGKLLTCYGCPAKLLPLIKMQPGQFVRAEPAGQFATIRVLPGELPGAPPQAAQNSWNITEARPVPGASRVVADWLDSTGKPTGRAAIVESANCLWLTHVLLADGGSAKDQLLLAMVGKLSPRVWQKAAETALAQVGQVGRCRSFAEALTYLEHAGAATATLEAVRGQQDAAAQLLAERRYPEAVARAHDAADAVKAAWCRVQQPVAGEFRAWWCHSAYGVAGRTWDQAIKALADNGFTAILPNMLWGGASFGQSDVLPSVAKEDQIALCLAACRKYGVQMHVWKVNWNTGWNVPPEFLAKLRAAGRLQVSSRGADEPWLCPSHPDNQQLEIDSMVEVAKRYAVDGLHFDYIRYPDGDHCFCPGCRERFGRAVGAALPNWPQEALAGGAYRQQWLDWRRSNINVVVKGVSVGARAVRPGIKLSAAVFRNWATDRDGVGQDWKLWCDNGWLDFVCPMDYTTSDAQFAGFVTKQREWAGNVPVYPGIGASATGIRMGPDRVIEQIRIARQKGAGGFTIFNYAEAEATGILPYLGMGITRAVK